MFKRGLLYSLSFCFLMACDNKVPNTAFVKSEVKDSVSVDSSYSTVSKEIEVLDESTLTRTEGYSFIGKIDHKYAIEMVLAPTKSSSANCQTLSGNYSYTSSNIPISLDGEICFDQQTIKLQHRKEENIEERFEGVFISNLSKIQGTWTKAKKKQSLPFELHNLMNQGNKALFVAALSSILADDAEAPSAQDIAYDKQGVYIESLAGPHLDYTLSPGSFSASSYYSSTMRSSDYKTAAYLKKLSFKEAYVAITVNEHHNEYYDKGKDEEETPEISEETTYGVWIYQDDKIVNIFVSEGSEARHPIYATLKANTLTIIDQVSQKEQKL